MDFLNIFHTGSKAVGHHRQMEPHSPLDAVAHRITSSTRGVALVLPEEARQVLRQISARMRARRRLYRRIGFFANSYRNRGVCVIFAGGSHQDRTLAAGALANDIGYDLYRIDLTTVVSKYVSETEQNLRRILDLAGTSRVILLFDEADTLFGKRSEAMDGRGRHGSIETSYLLKRIEQFKGLAILATNMKPKLEREAVRRIQYIVNFNFPEAKKRKSEKPATIGTETHAKNGKSP